MLDIAFLRWYLCSVVSKHSIHHRGHRVPQRISICHSDDRREEDELLRARPKNLGNIHVDALERGIKENSV